MKKSKQIVPICILVGFVLFIFIAFYLIKGSLEEYNTANSRNLTAQQDLEQVQLQEKEIAEKQRANELELNSIKPVMAAPDGADPQTLSVFGDMNGKLIGQIARSKDLYLRSIDYSMSPKDDLLLADYGDSYNVCAVKLFLVGTYFSFHKFLQEFSQQPYFSSIANLDISTYPDNTDYILIHLTINLYSKKPTDKK